MEEGNYNQKRMQLDANDTYPPFVYPCRSSSSLETDRLMKKEMIDIRITDCTERVVLIPPYVRVYRRKHSSELADLLKLIDYHIILILV